MLDDLKLLHARDPQDILGFVERQHTQLSQNIETTQHNINVDNIVFAAMGGSAIAALIGQIWPGYSRPFEIVRNYDIPNYVSENTFFIAASSSGNTEETIEALNQAENKGAQIAVIAGGGKLVEIAKAKGYPLALLPKTDQPRFSTLTNFRAFLLLLQGAGLIDGSSISQFEQCSDFLEKVTQEWVPTVPTKNNLAKQLAEESIGNSLVIYSGPKLWPAAYKWKINFNENAKQVVWANQYPEFNHNEFMGWTKQPTQKPYIVFEIRSSLEHPRVQKRFEVSDRLLSGMRPSPNVINPVGDSVLEQLLWTFALGDFVSVYTAILSGIDPAPVELVNSLKKGLDE